MNKFCFVQNSNAEGKLPFTSDEIAVFLAGYAANGVDFFGLYPSVVSPYSVQSAVDTAIANTDNGVRVVTKDTYTQFSLAKLDKPYPIAGRLVVIQTFGQQIADLQISQDLGDYIKILVSGDSATASYILIGVSKSTLTDAYTPFSTFFSNGSYNSKISFFDFKDVLAASLAYSTDAVMSNIDVRQSSSIAQPSNLSQSAIGVYSPGVSTGKIAYGGTHL